MKQNEIHDLIKAFFDEYAPYETFETCDYSLYNLEYIKNDMLSDPDADTELLNLLEKAIEAITNYEF